MDWTSKLPPYESQYSALTHTDAQDCVSESLCHILYCLCGVRYSPRALAYLSKTTPTGSDVSDVLAAANNNGLIPYTSWPTPDSFTWESYYEAIPSEILALGVSLGIKLIPPSLNTSPLWTELEWGSNLPVPTRHMVTQINETQYFDSEQGAPIKPLNYEGAKIVYQTSILITKPMNQTQVALSKDGKTVYLCTPIALEWADFLKQANVEGIIVPDQIPPTSSL